MISYQAQTNLGVFVATLVFVQHVCLSCTCCMFLLGAINNVTRSSKTSFIIRSTRTVSSRQSDNETQQKKHCVCMPMSLAVSAVMGPWAAWLFLVNQMYYSVYVRLYKCHCLFQQKLQTNKPQWRVNEKDKKYRHLNSSIGYCPMDKIWSNEIAKYLEKKNHIENYQFVILCRKKVLDSMKSKQRIIYFSAMDWC